MIQSIFSPRLFYRLPALTKAGVSLILILTLTLALLLTLVTMPSHAEPTVTVTTPNPAATHVAPTDINQPAIDPNSLASQLQPTNEALSQANQELLSRNAQLQREVNDLQTQVNVLIYESKGQMFLYGAFTVIVSVLLGIFISWFLFTRRQTWLS